MPGGAARSAGSRLPYWPGWTSLGAGLGALVLYAFTLAPGLTWAHGGADGGDLLAAALTGGVPHPTGYPTYQLLLRLAVALYPGDPARAGNWLSALCTSAAAALLADLARRVLAQGWGAHRSWHPVAAMVAGLAWAASPAPWSQALITEVYALNALACAALLWLLWDWREAAVMGGRAAARLAVAGLVFGLALGNHVSAALILPGAAAWLWSTRRVGPAARRGWPWAAAAVLAGLSVYAYLPLAARTAPPINWGDPQTPARLWWVATGQLYRGLLLGATVPGLLDRLPALAGEVTRQFGGPWATLLVVGGLWWTDRHQRAWWRATGLIALAHALLALGYRSTDAYVYLIPAWIVAALWLAAGLVWFSERLGGLVRTKMSGRSLATGLVVALLAGMVAVPVVRFYGSMDLSGDRAARDFVSSALAQAGQGAVILAATDQPTFALWYGIYGLKLRPDLIPLNVNLYGFEWYRTTVAGQHPDPFSEVGIGQPLEELAIALAGRRPLYRAEALDLHLASLVEEPAGTLVRLLAK